MKKALLVLALVIVMLAGCGKNSEVVKLTPGTPLYELAKELSGKIPVLDPDKNDIIVKTKGFNVTSGELIASLKRNFGNRIDGLKNQPAEQLSQILKQQAEGYATTQMLFLAAKKARLSPKETAVDSVLNVRYQRSGGQEKFIADLKTNGLTVEEVREDINKFLTVNTYLDRELADEIKVTDEDIQKEYDQEKTATVRHILMLTQGKNETEKMAIRKKMEEVLALARNGEDFAELAKQYSEDPGSKDKGGIYENFTRGRMVKEFEDASFNLPIGSISDIVETRYGFHIIKVMDRQKETRPIEDVREQIKSKLDNTKRRDAYQFFVQKLKQDNGYELIGL
ncbi:MAG: foldase protein PrsA [Candidatus Zhuqueibacterota bacterium]